MSRRQTWIILGGSSAIARAFTRAAAARGCDVVLAGRDMEDLQRSAADAAACYGVNAHAFLWDAQDAPSRLALLEHARSIPGIINVALFAAQMPPQRDIDANPALVLQTIDAGFAGPAATLHALAPVLESRDGGAVVGVGSVAGDRGRLPNYVYGSAKAGLHAYLEGLRNRLGRRGVHVLTVKPGVIDTAMTWGMKGMIASPDLVADAIFAALARKRLVIYTPWPWRFIMLFIRHIPERIFMRLSF